MRETVNCIETDILPYSQLVHAFSGGFILSGKE